MPLYLEFSKEQSSLIESMEYYDELEELDVVFRSYFWKSVTFCGVPLSAMVEMASAKSKGSYLLNHIKPNFKTKNHKQMATEEKKVRKTKNKASDEKRFIKLRIDVKKLMKEWFFVGEKGVYADLTLFLLPDGEVDQHGNLGMIVQDVPEAIYKKETDSKVKKDARTKGPILGNGAEMDWSESNEESQPGATISTMGAQDDDDLPF